MGTFNTSFSPNTDDVDINDIYGQCLYYARADSPSVNMTYEGLNGAINYSNFTPFDSTADGLEAGCFRSGSFARGYNYGFNFPDRYHASQFCASSAEDLYGYDPSKRLFHVHQSFAVRFFCPWPAACFIGYQGFFTGDLTKWDDSRFTKRVKNSFYFGERWDLRLRINGHAHLGSYVKVPSTRTSTAASETTGATTTSKDEYSVRSGGEYRYRWSQRSLQFQADKGFNTVEVMNWPKILRPYSAEQDPESLKGAPKMVTECGGIWVLAVRLGADEEYFEYNEQGHTAQVSYDGGVGTNHPFPPGKLSPDYGYENANEKTCIDAVDMNDPDIDVSRFTPKAQERFRTVKGGSIAPIKDVHPLPLNFEDSE